MPGQRAQKAAQSLKASVVASESSTCPSSVTAAAADRGGKQPTREASHSLRRQRRTSSSSKGKVGKMRKGLHPQMQWISYVTQSGRLMNIMMTKIGHTGKVYHMRAKRQMAQSLGQIAKFKRRYELEAEDNNGK